jgi:hypothetical protein
MRLALESPVELLKEVQPLGDFDWILTHLVLKDEEYAKFYRESTRYKILDNSVNELGTPSPMGDIKKAVEILGGVNGVVPPDHLGNHFATEKALDEAIGVFGKGQLLPVVQGHEFRYVLECADYIKKLGFTEVAVPYDITCSRYDSIEKMSERRQEVVSRMILLYSFDVHLLGMTTLEELASYSGIEKVKSVDTGSPVMHGLWSLRFGRDKLLPKSTPTMEQMKLLGNPNLNSVYYNIGYLRGILSGGNEVSSRT